MRYVIFAYPYTHASGGGKVLHRLCHELRLRGEDAYVTAEVTNPEWDTPTWRDEMTPDVIAVYPEIVRGNPLGAWHVARWVLNVPGKLGGDGAYAPSEMVFSWDPSFLDGVPLLHLPAVETDIYRDRHEPRSGALYFVGKGDSGAPPNASPVTLAMRLDRYALADALNRAEVLYSLDGVTAMAQIALLCGCPVVIVPTGERLEADSDAYRAQYLAQWDTFREQLRDFVAITQRVAVPA